MVIVRYFTLGKPEKAWFPRKNIEKGSKTYSSIINRIQFLFSFLLK